MKILFFGTPMFAVASLKKLVDNGCNIVAVVTAPDKPAGRGQKLHVSDVKSYALEQGLKILQPIKLNDPDFLAQMNELNPDLSVVVAFRMLPEKVWQFPRLGTINLHGSLLPNYRGAAPINRAVMNGETHTGVTTFFLKHEIDTGNVIDQQVIPIGSDETAGELHDRMKEVGANLLLTTVQSIEAGTAKGQEQSLMVNQNGDLKHAPKLFKNDCKLDFSLNVNELHNQVRGLSPFPGAFFELKQDDNSEVIAVKIFKSEVQTAGTVLTHEFITDNKTFLKISADQGFLIIKEIQFPGKKKMMIEEFLRGVKFGSHVTVV